MLTKISICLFLLRILETKRVKFFMYGMIAFLVLFTAVCVAMFLGVCRPLRAYWDVDVDGVCLSENQIKKLIIAQGGRESTSKFIPCVNASQFFPSSRTLYALHSRY